jgi:RNA polymerase sigma-70 factor (ECF subfamily)
MWTARGKWSRRSAATSRSGDRAVASPGGSEKTPAQRFFAAAEQGDRPMPEALLAQDVALHADGGAKTASH